MIDFDQTYDEGVCLYEQKKYEEAAKLFGSIMQTYENYSAAFCYGCCLTRLGKYEEAVNFFTKMLILCPEWENLWYELGYAYLKNKNMQNALSCLLKAKDIAPDHPRVLFYLGLYYEKTDDFEKAIAYYKRSLKAENCFGVNASLAVCYYYTEDFEEALKYAEEAYRLKPNSVDSLFYYTRLLVKNKKYQKGFDVFRTTELNYEYDAELLITYIICSLRTGNIKYADDAHVKLKKIDSTSKMVCDYEMIKTSLSQKKGKTGDGSLSSDEKD